MKIGIVSDAHGKVERLDEALDRFERRRVRAVVFCGDATKGDCIAALARDGWAAYAVAGNMDRGREAELTLAAVRGRVVFSSTFVVVDLGDGRKLAATHGHVGGLAEKLIASGQYACVCFGHTHRVCDRWAGRVHVINPGALVHSRDPGYPTAAVLDTDDESVEFLRLDADDEGSDG